MTVVFAAANGFIMQADSANKLVCTNLAVPAPARRVVAPYGESAMDGS